MKFDIPLLLTETLKNPQDTARKLFDSNLNAVTVLFGFILATIVSVILTFISNGLKSIEVLPNVAIGPLLFALISTIITGLLVVTIVYCGSILQGKRAYIQGFVAIIWVKTLQIFLQIIQIVIILFSIPLGDSFGVVGTIVLLWVLINFINALHGFKSNWKAALVFFLSVVSVTFVLLFLIILSGYSVPHAM